jgi:hypothetical protein
MFGRRFFGLTQACAVAGRRLWELRGDKMDSGHLVIPILLFAPILWVLMVLIIGIIVGAGFGAMSLFCVGPWLAFAEFAERHKGLDKTAPFLIWGTVLMFPLFDQFGMGRRFALWVMSFYFGVALLLAVLQPRRALNMFLGYGTAIFDVFTVILYSWGKALIAMVEWFRRRIETLDIPQG